MSRVFFLYITLEGLVYPASHLRIFTDPYITPEPSPTVFRWSIPRYIVVCTEILAYLTVLKTRGPGRLLAHVLRRE